MVKYAHFDFKNENIQYNVVNNYSKIYIKLVFFSSELYQTLRVKYKSLNKC